MRAFLCYVIVVREGISKALLLTNATSTNGEETLERKRRLQVALKDYDDETKTYECKNQTDRERKPKN